MAARGVSSARAQLADVAIGVDGSGSMAEEASLVEAALADLATTKEASGIDVHVIVVSRTGEIPSGICVPPPLGSGTCPTDKSLPPVATRSSKPRVRWSEAVISEVVSDSTTAHS